MKTKRLFPGALLIVSLTLVLRLPYVINISILQYDEATYAVRGAMMNRPGAVLYVDVFADTAPLMNYLYAAVYALARDQGKTILSVQCLGIIWTLLTTAVIYRIARKFESGKAAFPAALFYAVFSTTFGTSETVAANAELFMVLPLAIGALFFLRGLRTESGRDYLFAGGFCGVGFLFKQPGIVDLGAMLALPSLLALAGKADFRAAGRTVLLVIAGFLAPLVLISAYFLSRGALREFYFWSWAYRFRYVGAVPLSVGVLTALEMMWRLVVCNFVFWVFVFFSLASVKSLRFKSGYAFCWLWGLFSILGAAAGRRHFPHYYIQVIPPFSVLAGLGVFTAMEWLRPADRRESGRGRHRAAVVVIAASLALTALVAHHETAPGWNEMGIRDFFRFRRFPHPQQEMGDYIRENTREADTIFVWGFSPQLYVLSGRLPGTRYMLVDPLIGVSPPDEHTGYFPGVMENFLRDLESNRPVYFVDTSFSPHDRFCAEHPVSRYPRLKEYLQENYRLEREIDRKLFYRRRDRGPAEVKPDNTRFPRLTWGADFPGLSGSDLSLAVPEVL